MLLSAAAPSAEALASFQGNQVAQTAEYSELLGFDPASVMNAKTGSKVAPQAYQTPTATPVASKGVDPAVKNILAQTSVYVVSSDASKTAAPTATGGTPAHPTAIPTAIPTTLPPSLSPSQQGSVPTLVAPSLPSSFFPSLFVSLGTHERCDHTKHHVGSAKCH